MTLSTTKRRGPPKGIYRSEPIFRDKVLTIVRMRELEHATFGEIAGVVGGTRMNACNSFRRWRDWGLRELSGSPSAASA